MVLNIRLFLLGIGFLGLSLLGWQLNWLSESMTRLSVDAGGLAMIGAASYLQYLRYRRAACRWSLALLVVLILMTALEFFHLVVDMSMSLGGGADALFDPAQSIKLLVYSCLLLLPALLWGGAQAHDVSSDVVTEKTVAQPEDADGLLAKQELLRLVQAVREGNHNYRAVTEQVNGDWRTILQGANYMLDETSRPLGSLTGVLLNMADGRLTTRMSEQFKGEHSQLSAAINSMAAVAGQVTHELDALNVAFDSGNYGHRANVEQFSGDWRKILEVVNRIVAAVHQTTQEVQAQNWVKTGLASLSTDLRSDMSLEELARLSINFLASYTESQAAAMYVFDREQRQLNLVAGFALDERAESVRSFALGSGLVGQVGRSCKAMLVKDVPEEVGHIVSGTSNVLPRQLILMPLLYEGEIKGVLELSRVAPCEPLVLEFLRAAADMLGSLFTTVQINENTKHLLAQSQQQAEQLQLQQEILKQNNEELEQQTQALRVSEEELRTQQEELQQTNEDLEMRAQCMEALANEIKRQNEELEEAQSDLYQRAEDLALASKYKGEFLANMSHELRTPLNSMLLLSRSLADNREGNLSQKQVQAAKVMHQSGKDLLSIINDILDLSKIEAGREVMVSGEVDLQEMGSHLSLLYEHVAQEKGLQFAVNLDPALPRMVMSDQQRLGQIVRNLLTNAFKFTAKGGVTLDIKLAGPDFRAMPGGPLENSTQRVMVLAVIDTGIGIPLEKQRHIWEAFQQADGSTSREYGGTGLGLTISRELAKLLGGEIQLSSEPGKGSTFALCLPVIEPEAGSATDVAVSSTPVAAVVTSSVAATSSSNTSALSEANTSAEPAAKSSIAQKWLAAAAAAAVESDSSAAMTVSSSAAPASSAIPAPAPAPAPVTAPVVSAPAPVAANTTKVVDDRDALAENEKAMLIIEKDPDFAQTLTRLCRENGAKYLLANSAEDARELLGKYNILGIFLDMLLPGRGGWEVLSYLKENARFMHIPVFVTSSDEDARRAMSLGAAGFLQKPFAADQFGKLFAKANEINEKTIKNLLLVEDDMGLRLAVHELLKAQDVNIIEASNGKSALEIIAQGNIDLIILDLGLPDMDGFSVLDRAQAVSEVKLPPVIVFTGRELTREEYERLQVYAANVIVKGDRSDERLVDEAALFLHRRVADLPDHARKMLASLHDREGMFVNKKVLLVDDDMRNIFALVGILESRDLQVITAKNGQEALDQLAQNPTVDLILTDIMMPIMDGYELIRKVRSQSKFSRLPIIALTAKAMKEDRERCLEAGASDYLSKPIDADRLFSMMRVWMYR